MRRDAGLSSSARNQAHGGDNPLVRVSQAFTCVKANKARYQIVCSHMTYRLLADSQHCDTSALDIPGRLFCGCAVETKNAILQLRLTTPQPCVAVCRPGGAGGAQRIGFRADVSHTEVHPVAKTV